MKHYRITFKKKLNNIFKQKAGIAFFCILVGIIVISGLFYSLNHSLPLSKQADIYHPISFDTKEPFLIHMMNTENINDSAVAEDETDSKPISTENNSAEPPVSNESPSVNSPSPTTNTEENSHSNLPTPPITNTARVKAESIQINTTYVELTEGAGFQLYASLFPENSTADIMYTSYQPDIASVDSSGYIQAIAGGHATICVSSTDGFAVTLVTVDVQSIYKYTPDGRIYMNDLTLREDGFVYGYYNGMEVPYYRNVNGQSILLKAYYNGTPACTSLTAVISNNAFYAEGANPYGQTIAITGSVDEYGRLTSLTTMNKDTGQTTNSLATTSYIYGSSSYFVRDSSSSIGIQFFY